MFRHVPNLLTGFRLAAAPATAGLLTTGHFDAAFGIFAVAGASDAADGFLAKRFGLTSRLGSYLDPMADKALMLAAFVALNILGAVPLWLTLVIVARELLFFAAIGAALAAGAPLIIRPLLIGKVSTALQVLYITAHLAALAFGVPLQQVEPGGALVVAGVTLLSVAAYAVVWLRAMRAPSTEGASKA